MRVDLRELNLSGKVDVTAMEDTYWYSGEKPPSGLRLLAQNIWLEDCSSQVKVEDVILRRSVIHRRPPAPAAINTTSRFPDRIVLTDSDAYRTGAFQPVSYTRVPPFIGGNRAYESPSFYYESSSSGDEFYSPPSYKTPVPPPAAAKTTRLPSVRDRRVRAQNQDWADENPSFLNKNSSPCDEFYSPPPYQTPVPPPAAAKTTRLPGIKDRRVRAQNQDWADENPSFYNKNSSPCDEFYSQPPYQTWVPPHAAAKTTRLPGIKDRRVRTQNQDWAYENPSLYNKNSSPCDEFYSQPPYQTWVPPHAAAKTTTLPGIKDRRARAQNQDWADENPSRYYKNSSPCDEFYSQPPYQTPVPPPAEAKTTRLPGIKDGRVRAQNQDWAYENPSLYNKNSSPCDEFYSQPPYQTPVPPPAEAKTTRLPGIKDGRVRAQNQDWADENPSLYNKNSSPCDEFYSQPPYQTPVPPPAEAKTTRLPGIKDGRVRAQNQDWADENPSLYNKNSSPCDEFYSQPPYQTPVPPPAEAKTTRLPSIKDGRVRAQNQDRAYENPSSDSASPDDGGECSQKSFPRKTFRKKTPGDMKKGQVIPDLSSTELPDRSKEGLNYVFELLDSNDWTKVVEGLKQMQDLAEHQDDVLQPELRKVCRVVCREVNNLRSVVSRTAVTTMASIYTHLKRSMDEELKVTAATLLHKAGQVSIFMCKEVNLALSSMVENCSPVRVLDALLAGGFGHKSPAVRISMSLHLEELAESMGAAHVLKGDDFTSKFLIAISKLAFDANGDVRLHARNTMRTLGAHPACDKMVGKFIPAKERATIKKLFHT